MRKISYSLILFFIFYLLIAKNSYADEGKGAASFLNLPITARAAAMGGASVAITNDASAVYWNPASLGLIKRFSFLSSIVSLKLGNNGNLGTIESDHYFIAAAIPLKRLGTIGIGWRNFVINDIEIYYDKEYSASDAPEDYFDNTENAFFIAYGLDIVPDCMSVGVSAKLVQQNYTVLEGASAQGMGFSIGLAYRATKNLRLALRADDNFTMEWENDHKDQVLFKGLAGMALSLLQDHILMGLDLEQVRDRSLTANCGAEFNIKPAFLKAPNGVAGFSHLAIRAGIDDMDLENRYNMSDPAQINFTYGLGLGLFAENLRILVDYSFRNYQIGAQNQFTITISF